MEIRLQQILNVKKCSLFGAAPQDTPSLCPVPQIDNENKNWSII